MSNEDALFVTNFSVTILTDSLFIFKITQVVECLRCFESELSKKKRLSHPSKRSKVYFDCNISIQNFFGVSNILLEVVFS